MSRSIRSMTMAVLLAAGFAGTGISATPLAPPSWASTAIHYRTARIDGLDIFYREAGPADAPTILLLHGFPSSSREFRNLIPALAGRYHVVAPDYPGFGRSSAPSHDQFAYTFDHLTDVVDALLDRIGVQRYTMYIQDYGAPIGERLALRHPERVTGFIVQNGNAYAEGMGAFWDPVKAYWADGSPDHREALAKGLTPESVQWQYLNGVRDPSRVDPENWFVDQALLDRAGPKDIQLDLVYDYRTNVALYPRFHAFLRDRQPPTLIVWGGNDGIFLAPGARAFLRDLPHAELHILDTGHFALEDKADEMIALIRDFLARSLPARTDHERQ